MSKNEETELSWLQGLSQDSAPSTTREDLVEARWAAGDAARRTAEQADAEHGHEEARENHDEWLRSLGGSVTTDPSGADDAVPSEPVLVEDEAEEIEQTLAVESAADEAEAVEQIVDETVVVESALDETVAAEPAVDETAVSEPAVADPAVAEPVADETVVAGPAVEETAAGPVSDADVVVDPALDEPGVTETSALENAVDENAIDQNVDDETVPAEGVADDTTAGSDDTATAALFAGADAAVETADDSAAEPGSVAPAKKSRWRKPALIASAATVVVLAAGGGIALALTKEITVQADGQTITVSTFAGDVAGALAAAQVDVGQYDDVTPAVGDPIEHKGTIVIDRARLVTVSLDGDLHQTWTTAETLDEALGELGVRAGAGEQLELSADRKAAIPEGGLQVEAAITFPVTLTDGAKAAEQVRTDVDTVAELLTAQEIELGEHDVITPAVTASLAPGDTVSIDRVAITSVTDQVEVPQPADTSVDDPQLAQGLTEVAEAGNPGVEAVTFQVTTVNGAETERVETAREVQTAAKASVVRVGTRVPDPAEKYADPANWSTNWDGIARCESTNNWAINTGNGYYGGLQFDRRTWLGAGGGVYGDTANLATKEQQIYIAEQVYASRGLSPWACGHAG